MHPLSTLKENISQTVVGQATALEFLLVGLLAEGHVLIDDVPGMGKTLLAKSLSASLACDFRRIQFTSDLTPTDVSGFFIYDRKENDFIFRPGPVLTNILLADEINRTVPRTQSSLLEAMEEKQITVDGHTFPLPKPFMVIATQNPVEQEGTFPLPEAQLDRFMLKISMGYPSPEQEEQIVALYGTHDPLAQLKAVACGEDVLSWQSLCRKITVHPSITRYIVALVNATREHSAIRLGASPRASVVAYKACQALAFLHNRDFVIPDDVKQLAHPIFVHRLILRREDRLRGLNGSAIVDEILTTVPAPV